MRTDVLLDVNWEGRETEHGNVVYGWHLGTVCVVETECSDGLRFEVYVSHQLSDDETVMMHWSMFSDRDLAVAHHDMLVRQLKEVGEHGLYARRFESRSELATPSLGQDNRRCIVCWKGQVRCTCSAPTFLEDVEL